LNNLPDKANWIFAQYPEQSSPQRQNDFNGEKACLTLKILAGYRPVAGQPK